MDSELSTLTELLHKFDRNLFCKRTGDGVVRVYHNKKVMRPYDIDGATVYFEFSEPYHVFSLTDTWGYNGEPRKWGYLPIFQKLQMVSDVDRTFKELEESEKIHKAREEREIKNLTEDMAIEMRDAVRKDTNDVLTHSMDKTKDKRRLYDKRSL